MGNGKTASGKLNFAIAEHVETAEDEFFSIATEEDQKS